MRNDRETVQESPYAHLRPEGWRRPMPGDIVRLLSLPDRWFDDAPASIEEERMHRIRNQSGLRAVVQEVIYTATPMGPMAKGFPKSLMATAMPVDLIQGDAPSTINLVWSVDRMEVLLPATAKDVRITYTE